ncbi:uncharacterized protein BKA55DRAFT_595248 [Fusarium redolens]|uniref:Cerato-platanin n=1 Tax=Fusarium redolens TaxID=48865 RepID=A0A9P9K4H2_FUSRE|nr:uncharacterized protein BKA55DRAFT_595248 [Fusarium redolens]KAH7247693.1 hypothetical protein BKA55DRAFT_595248 [Fusarium redolens]
MPVSRLWLPLLVCTAAFWISEAHTTLPNTHNVVSITPHDQYSSSIGVLGCKVDTNRIAYWPLEVGCDGICVKVANNGRFLHLLRIDISYDAWNYLVFGTSAVEDSHLGGGIQMSYEIVDTSKCQHLLKDGKLPLSAANSMNYVSSCISKPTSWVAQNYELYNIYDLVCNNQPHCPGGLGSMLQLNSTAKNVMYATGELIPA